MNDSNKVLNDKSTNAAALEYNSEQEYERHQKVNQRFFLRLSKNEKVREAIKNFQEEIENTKINNSQVDKKIVSNKDNSKNTNNEGKVQKKS
jgi:hypothetical protein